MTSRNMRHPCKMFCKRPCFNDEYLPTFNRDNVTLVDTGDFGGVERITENAVVVDGVTPSFYNNEGFAKDTTATFTGDAYAGGANAFEDVLIDWRENQQMEGLDFSK